MAKKDKIIQSIRHFPALYELSIRLDGKVNVWCKFDVFKRGIGPEWVVVNVVDNWAAGMVYIEQSERAGHPLKLDYAEAA